MNEKNGTGERNYTDTILYRNAQAVMDTLASQKELIEAMQVEIQRLTAVTTVLVAEQAQTRHLVDTMWVSWMGHGSTEPPATGNGPTG